MTSCMTPLFETKHVQVSFLIGTKEQVNMLVSLTSRLMGYDLGNSWPRLMCPWPWRKMEWLCLQARRTGRPQW